MYFLVKIDFEPKISDCVDFNLSDRLFSQVSKFGTDLLVFKSDKIAFYGDTGTFLQHYFVENWET